MGHVPVPLTWVYSTGLLAVKNRKGSLSKTPRAGKRGKITLILILKSN